MKRLLLFLMLSVALVFGFATTGFAKEITVQKGDTMWSIAKRYHVPFLEVLRLNMKHHIDVNLIHPKDIIYLPEKGTGTNTNTHSSNDKITEKDNTPSAAGVTDHANAVLQLVNAERSKQGLKSLTLSNKLTQIANTKAADMGKNNYFSHTSPTYGSPFQMLQHFGVTYRTAGENIAAGQKTPKEVMQAWMNSSGHRANILNANYTEIGVGYYAGGSYGTEWVQLFTGN